ncbi:hypothetical protein ACHAWF_005675 [Thalassiosira exigua]
MAWTGARTRRAHHFLAASLSIIFSWGGKRIMCSTEATTSPPTFIFIRIIGPETKDDDDGRLLVQQPQGPRDTSRSDVRPVFSRDEYEALVSGKGTTDAPPPDRAMSKLFSFPLPESAVGSGRDSADESKSNDCAQMASVYESVLIINEGRVDACYKVISMAELFQLVETRPSCINQSLIDHVLHLYRQRKRDSRIPNRRLLLGSSGSNIDAYTLRPKPAVLFLDCDDCLYFDDWHIAGHLTKKIEEHCQQEFGLPKGYAYTLYKQHGTALRGLIAEGYLSKDGAVDVFLDSVHDLPIHELLSPDVELREMLLKVDPSIRKFVFTASVSHHAQRCLEALGIVDLIEGIIDVKDCQFETKHSVSSFHAAMKKAGVDDPESCVFLDDSVKNIEAARKVGWRSVLVGRIGRDCGKPVTSEHAEHEVDRIHQLPDILPELFLPKGAVG